MNVLPDPFDNRRLGVRAAADLIGVSITTIKRWCSDGALASIRTPGGHRRIKLSNLEALRTDIFGEVTGSELSLLHPLEIEELVSLLLAGDERQVLERVAPLLRSAEAVPNIMDDLLSVAMWRVGEMWSSAQIDVYQEHLCTETMSSVLESLRFLIPVSRAQPTVAVGGTLQGNTDTIASKMACLTFKSVGIQARNLGCNLPVESIVKAAVDFGASIVWICHTHISDVATIQRAHLQLRSSLPSDVKVCIGGGALTLSIKRMLSVDMHNDSFGSLFAAFNPTSE